MTVTVAEMTRDVRIALDMNRDDGELFLDGDSDTADLDEAIASVLAEAVRDVVMEAPNNLLESGHEISGEVYWLGDGAGMIILPDDFMRLVCFRMSDWDRAVFDPMAADSPAYGLQSSRFPGLRGNPRKPAAAVVRRSEGLVLEFWSCPGEDAHVAQGAYIPWPHVDRHGGIDVPRPLYRGAVRRAAELVKSSLNPG